MRHNGESAWLKTAAFGRDLGAQGRNRKPRHMGGVCSNLIILSAVLLQHHTRLRDGILNNVDPHRPWHQKILNPLIEKNAVRVLGVKQRRL